MRHPKPILLLLIIIATSCVDRLFYEVEPTDQVPIAISGHITNEPGPYKVSITKGFDIESRVSLKVPVSAKRLTIIDERGTSEVLTEKTPGNYETDPAGIRGRIGGIYKLLVEFEDGTSFESLSDTILAPGSIDSIYHDFNPTVNFSPDVKVPFDVNNLSSKTRYGFDVSLNSRGNNSPGTHYKWDLKGTFESDTQPWEDTGKCSPIPKEGIPCNWIPPCTGLRNAFYTTDDQGYIEPSGFRRVFPCTCCKCWYDFYSNVPMLSSRSLTAEVVFNDMFIYRVPLVDWLFMYQVRVEVSQSSITQNTYEYFQVIRNQREAANSLFQPVGGKLPGEFIQEKGAPASVRGIFYAAGVARKHIYLSAADMDKGVTIPEVDFELPGMGAKSCLTLFPNATSVKPEFWID